MATTSERSELAEAPKQPKKDKPNSLSYHTYKEKDKRERTDEEQPKRPKYGRFGALPPELSGVKINTDAIPVIGEAVEQMYRKKLQERIAQCQQDPMLQVFNDCVEDIMKKTKPHRKKEKKSKERERGESKEKKKKKKRSKEEDDKKAKKKKKKSEKELASLSSTVASSSRVQSSVVLASSSSKRDSNNGAPFSTPRPIHSVVQRPKPVHHRPISHGDWRDDRWQGRVPDQHYSSEQHSGRSSYISEAWPPAAPSYSWDDGRSRPSDHRRSSDAPVEPPPAVRSDHPRGSSRRGAKSYTGYNYKDDRSRSRSRSPPERAERRPSPPKDMPEHIRWLHERWRKYDKNFFSKQEKPQEQPARSKGPTAEERRSYNAQMVEYTRERRGRGANTEPMGEGGRRFTEDKPAAAAKKFGIPYYQFRSGGEFGWNPGRMYTFKEFLLSQPEDIEDQERAVNMYNDYKLEFRKKALAEFFQAHSEDEWFLEKYHPMLRARREAFRREKVAKRLDAFMQLLVRGYMEVSIDAPCSRKIRKLMDSVIVLLEGGDEGDIACLSDLDYMLEEKREQAEEKKTAVKADDSSDDEEKAEVDPNKVPDTIGKAPGQGRTKEERMADEEEGVAPTEEALEQMQHARDYSLYVREHEGGPDMSEAPDDLEPAGLV
uniref:SERRATE/Ars2 N-terminal domain-containing protein n=1 Tax=Plectus sambesii TaxID=2011161 RepID=A0A914WQF4_9BILA